MKTMLELCAGLPRQTIAAGGCLIEEGVPDGALYVLAAGRVEILKDRHSINLVDSPGAVFGEVSLLLDQPPMATVRCLADCAFFVAADGSRFLQQYPEACWHVARVLARRLNGLTHYLIDLKAQFADRQDHLGMVDEVLESLLHHQKRVP